MKEIELVEKINKVDNVNEVDEINNTKTDIINDIALINDFNLTTIPYINRKYKEFYEKNGYIPEIFNAYNCYEVMEIAPTITTNCGNASGTSSILIIQ